MSAKQVERWAPWLLLAAVLVLWQLLVQALAVPDYLFPSPWEIVQQIAEFKGPLLAAAWSTFWVTLVGFALAIVVGVLLGFLIGSSRVATSRSWVRPSRACATSASRTPARGSS